MQTIQQESANYSDSIDTLVEERDKLVYEVSVEREKRHACQEYISNVDMNLEAVDMKIHNMLIVIDTERRQYATGAINECNMLWRSHLRKVLNINNRNSIDQETKEEEKYINSK